jgi:hypothetical protein
MAGVDIGIWNISHFSDGMMGYRTPNIARVAKEGEKFTDYYGQQSCTAGRAAFICGQNPLGTGLTKKPQDLPSEDEATRAGPLCRNCVMGSGQTGCLSSLNTTPGPAAAHLSKLTVTMRSQSE